MRLAAAQCSSSTTFARLDEAEAEAEYEKILKDFGTRHWQTEGMFAERFEEVEDSLDLRDRKFTDTRKRLIGAYFCHEYTYAAAALMNPSIVPHPDQSGMDAGECRFVMSLRAVGEGHISSIVFREGIAYDDGHFTLWPQSDFATSVELDDSSLTDADRGVTVHRHKDSSLSNTVIFPITEQQRNGLEDLRLVRFDHDDQDYEWIGTYTAYSGSTIRSELLRTRDFTALPAGTARRTRSAQQGHGAVPGEDRRAIRDDRPAGRQEPFPAALRPDRPLERRRHAADGTQVSLGVHPDRQLRQPDQDR